MTLAEIRQDERVRAFLRARILFNNNNSTIECTIKNISASGAKIELGSSLSIPAEFDLDVPQKGRIFRAQMVWRDANSLGVRFLEKATPNGAELETHAAKLERENKRLRATVAALTKRLENLGQDVSASE